MDLRLYSIIKFRFRHRRFYRCSQCSRYCTWYCSSIYNLVTFWRFIITPFSCTNILDDCTITAVGERVKIVLFSWSVLLDYDAGVLSNAYLWLVLMFYNLRFVLQFYFTASLRRLKIVGTCVFHRVENDGAVKNCY